MSGGRSKHLGPIEFEFFMAGPIVESYQRLAGPNKESKHAQTPVSLKRDLASWDVEAVQPVESITLRGSAKLLIAPGQDQADIARQSLRPLDDHRLEPVPGWLQLISPKLKSLPWYAGQGIGPPR